MTHGVRRVLLLGGTSEIGLAIVRALRLSAGSEVVLAGRDRDGLQAAAASLPELTVRVESFDALEPDTLSDVIAGTFARGPIDIVVPSFGLLGDQREFERDPCTVDGFVAVNVTAQARALLDAARLLRAQGHGSLVVLSSIAGVRPRRANFVYGATKSAVDAVGQGLTDALAGTGVQVLVVRPGFVIGRMTAGMRSAPLSCCPADVGAAVARALSRPGSRTVWVPSALRLLAAAMRLTPRSLWRRLPR